MATLDVVNLENKKVGTITLSDSVFAAEINYPVIHQVVKAQLAGRRQGTAKTKVKSEVRGGGKKPFRQKGTGNARQGSTRSSLLVGGGQNFGPQPRCYEQRTPKKVAQLALRSAISERLKSGRLLIVDSFKLPAIKTKTFNASMANFGASSALLIEKGQNKNLELSCRNIIGLRVLRDEGTNPYDILKHEWLMLSQDAAKALDQRLACE